MATTISTNPGNFANRPTEEVREIAHKGGLAAHGVVEEEPVVSGNPGNFANRPTEEVQEIARKGGLAAAEETPVVVDIPEVRKTRSSVTTRLDEQMAEGFMIGLD
ncbi:uncharacterized protein LY89DRAFT_672020 [Mollisia scopiformis]|uniref:Uncharacterized protein n=1 Tax=Mollisia scopiformis TaxID=149040 RepID=A0A194X0L2_MOLSC|nr:uncharacterized protein LY89DRAFT_672020 [Mollisia scopiformis]KUJ13730.1 hypothetical protein LY89DRAFT_672020 [Mollisia scopiformis]